VGIGVTVLGCAGAYVLGIFALVQSFDDIDQPNNDGDLLQWSLGAAALAALVASGPAGYLIARSRLLLWGPTVLVVVPLLGWGLFGLVN
jgi:hypothetical protein